MTHAALTRIATTVAGAALVFGLGTAILGAGEQAGPALVAADSNPWNGTQDDSNPWNGTQDDDSNPWN